MQRYVKGNFTIVPNSNYLMAVSTSSQAVFHWLCHFADKEGQCFPSRKVLAQSAQMSVRTVDKSIAELEQSGMLSKVERKRKDGSLSSNLYQIIAIDDTGGSAKSALPSEESAHLELDLNNHTLAKAKDTSSELDRQVKIAFEGYKQFFEAPNTLYSNSRKAKLRLRVKNCGFDMVKQAIYNTSQSAFHRGVNDRKWKANIDFIIRNDEQVERLATMEVTDVYDPSED